MSNYLNLKDIPDESLYLCGDCGLIVGDVLKHEHYCSARVQTPIARMDDH